MGKLLRVLVVLIALLGIAACYFAYMNYQKREALANRAQIYEDFIPKIAGTLEKDDPADVAPPAFQARDTSPVTSREIETPERSEFWDSYNLKLEAEQAPEVMSINKRDSRFRKPYFLDPVTEQPVIDTYTGKPQTEGEGTLHELLTSVLDRAKAQNSVLNQTRVELKKIREELIDTIDELNKQKQEGRKDKREIEDLNAKVAKLTADLREKEAELEQKISELEDAHGQIEELTDQNDSLQEEISTLNDKITEMEQVIRELRTPAIGGTIPQVQGPVQEGVLTPGDKGKIVSCSDEWKYAIIEFSPEFMDELIGSQRDRPLPQVEVMVRTPGIENIDEAFVTRLKLRQAIRDKNIVIADILTDWEQKETKVGDIVFY